MTFTLSEGDVANVLKYEQLIPAMEKALSDFSAGRVIQPVRDDIAPQLALRRDVPKPVITALTSEPESSLLCIMSPSWSAGRAEILVQHQSSAYAGSETSGTQVR
jgi:hypothetical protein